MKKKLVSILLSLSMCATYAMPLAAAGPEAPEAPEVVETAAPMAYANTPTAIYVKGGRNTSDSKTWTFTGQTTSSASLFVDVWGTSDTGSSTSNSAAKDAEIEWTSSNDKVATVESKENGIKGELDVVGAGSTTIKAKAANIKGGNNTVTFSIKVEPKDISNGVSLTWEKPSTYFKDMAAFKASVGKAKKSVMSNLEVKDAPNSGVTLTRDKDYTVSVSGNAIATTTTHKSVTIIIKGKGNYDTTTQTSKAIDVNFYGQNVKYTKTGTTITYGETEKEFLNGDVTLDGVTLSSIENAGEKDVKYVSSDKKKVAVNKKGELVAKGVGSATVKVIPKKNTTAKQVNTLTVTVTAKSITSDDIVFDAEKNIKLAKAYKDAAAFKSKFIASADKKFVLKDVKKKMKGGSGKDFKVTVSGSTLDEIQSAKGEENVVKFRIEGSGNYKGVKTGSFVVPLQAQGVKDLADKEFTFGDKYDYLSEVGFDESKLTSFTVPDNMKAKCSKLKFEVVKKDILKVNKNGVMTAKKAGETVVKISPAKNTQKSTTSEVSITVNQADLGDGTTVTFKVPKGKYSDSEVKSAFNKNSVKVKNSKGKKLKNGTDFTVGTVSIADGSVEVTVNGKGNYTGSATGTGSYTLKQKKQNS